MLAPGESVLVSRGSEGLRSPLDGGTEAKKMGTLKSDN